MSAARRTPTPHPTENLVKKLNRPVAVGAAALLLLGAGAGAGVAASRGGTPEPGTVVTNLPLGSTNPNIASGVGIGAGTAIYKSSGTGPSVGDPTATPGTPQAYVDLEAFGGTVPEGVTLTEAQGLNALAAIGENLATVGLDYDDVITMRVFLDNEPGAGTADFAGWNRAYRQYFANVDLETGEATQVVLGTGAPAAPLRENAAVPSRSALEVGSLPVPGWLVEIEVDAVYPEQHPVD
ncbi:enamine deaminase RidA (YjgF/YER057c/UK114 family) [Kineococcus radiotolerans]|uniref:Enamine deaminase RidA (YjgF/YER057c/UK114 family) n=1 Tax=Kineococcus radiotolerans TaxID=131568 RepID=A0A7W4TLU1_KINRA|nr:Rid family hydrolase [Kineococcus radiotolerans]MBB2901298.1 enamine deaminase RidA (YjgF/YER057c/UK114 family) [Kineococcus radiotolerans]